MTELHITLNKEKVKNGELIFELELYYDTYNKKETLKTLGYKYDRPTWTKTVTLSGLDQSLQEATENEIKIHQMQISDLRNIYLAKYMYCEDEIKKFPVPSKPEILKNKIFNKKIYGAPGSYRIYLDNAETKISDETAEAIQKWLSGEDIEEYNASLQKLIRKSCRNNEYEDLIEVIEEQQQTAVEICRKYMNSKK